MEALGADRFIELATALDLAVMLVDAETLGVVAASDSATRLLGQGLRDVGERPVSWLSFMDGETLCEVRAFARSAREGGASSVRYSAAGAFRDSQTIRMTFLAAKDIVPEGTLAVGLDPDSARQIADHGAERLMEKEIETSARIQQALLAGSYTFEAPGASFAAETIPSLQVDGDFYEFYELEEGSVDFLIGDVMGKGLPAALTAATLKAAVAKAIIKEVVAHGDDVNPSRVLSEAERHIAPGLIDMGRFLTLYFCRLSASRGLLRFIDAGHTSFLYYDSVRDQCWQVKGSNMPFGFTGGQEFRSYALPCHRGDIFLFYSDGITEAENSEGSLFSAPRLMQLLAAHTDLSPENLVKKTLSMVFFYTAGAFRDDVTLLIAKTSHEGPKILRRFAATLDREKAEALSLLREAFAGDFAESYPAAAPEIGTEFSLALVEALGNVIRHTQGKARIDWEMTENRVTVGLEFQGKEYDWFATKEPDLESYPDHGFGSWLMIKSVDSILVLRGKNDENRIVMTRGLE